MVDPLHDLVEMTQRPPDLWQGTMRPYGGPRNSLPLTRIIWAFLPNDLRDDLRATMGKSSKLNKDPTARFCKRLDPLSSPPCKTFCMQAVQLGRI